MGIDYSINLYYKNSQIERALLGIINIADIYDEESTEIALPDGKTITFPFKTIPKKDSVKIAVGQEYTSFCTTLKFPIDKPIENYLENREFGKNGDLASIGFIYLMITVGEIYAEFSFTAATSGMSKLFLNSLSIQRTFIEFLESTAGLFGLFDVEESYYRSLSDLNIRVGDCETKNTNDNSDSFSHRIDNLTEACLFHKDCCLS